MAIMFLYSQDEMRKCYRGYSIDASCKIYLYLAKRFQRRRYLEIDKPEHNNCLWRPCLLTDLDEMSNLYRDPFIEAS